MKLIPLTQSKFAIVDDKNFEWLSQFRWYASKGSCTYYALSTFGKRPNRQNILMHRFILNVPKGKQTDHRNHNGLDNRECNIRICTHAQNVRNQRKTRGTSKYKGVYWRKDDKRWQAGLNYKSKTVYLGCFKDEIKAAYAYDKKAKELFGEFAHLNFKTATEKMAGKA